MTGSGLMLPRAPLLVETPCCPPSEAKIVAALRLAAATKKNALHTAVVIRNRESEKKIFTVPGWLFFYGVQIDAPLSGYGEQVLKPERRTERFEVTLIANEAKETDVPLGLLYDLRAGSDYRVRVSARLADGAVLTSNEIVVR